VVDKNGSNSGLKMAVHVFDKKLDFFTNNSLVSLTIIGVIGLAVRLFYFPFDVPLVLDAQLFCYKLENHSVSLLVLDLILC